MSIVATAATIARLIPLVVDGVKEGQEIIERLKAGELDAAQQAADWLGVTGDVEQAIENWEASKTT
jgi:hypothetical protein